MKRLRE
jgi:hypothetical protein